MSIYSDLISAYEKAAETLAGKVIDEPYNFHQIAGLITTGLLKTEVEPLPQLVIQLSGQELYLKLSLLP